MLFLAKFQWYETLRPTTPESVFDIPAEMDALMENSPIPYIPIPSAPDMRYELVTRPITPTEAYPSNNGETPENANGITHETISTTPLE